MRLSSNHEIMSPKINPQKGAPIFKIGLSVNVIRKQIKAPRLYLPLNDTTKEFCKILNKASPANVEINAGGVESIIFVNCRANTPNKIANKHMIKAEIY